MVVCAPVSYQEGHSTSILPRRVATFSFVAKKPKEDIVGMEVAQR